VTARLWLAIQSPVITRGWAEACLTRLEACPPELRAPVLAAAALSAFMTDDGPLAQRLAGQVLAEPARCHPFTSWTVRLVLAQIYTYTGQPERAIGLARGGRQEAADQGVEVQVGFTLGTEAMAWWRAGDYAAARRPAMEAVEIAGRVRNPGLSAYASFAAAAAVWHSEPQSALPFIEDSLTLTRAGAADTVLGNSLALAAVIRARNGDLPGALAALQELTVQHHADGSRVLLGLALRVAAGMLVRLGEAGPVAVLSGALAAHFPASISADNEHERTAAGKTQALARHALGETAYNAATGRGAAMDDNEVVRYAVSEFQRIAALLAQPGAQAPHAQPGPAPQPRATTAGPPRSA
jgi:hypothetical protein